MYKYSMTNLSSITSLTDSSEPILVKNLLVFKANIPLLYSISYSNWRFILNYDDWNIFSNFLLSFRPFSQASSAFS